jgi:tetratricopeptide (TPR) repeat protein
VFRHESGNFKKAIKMYDKAIALSADSASYYNNRGAAFFARRQFEPAMADYAMALKLDPEIFERISRAGVQAMLPSPEDRARYDYEIAKLYARSGIVDRSLHYLKKALEDGYKEIANVYKDNEFAELRKDPRFAELMAAKTVALPE